MPKKVQEIRGFNLGTKTSPSSSDIPLEANIWAENLDPISEPGKLKGVKDHTRTPNTNAKGKLIWPYHTSTSANWTNISGTSWGQSGGPANDSLLQDKITVNISYVHDSTPYTHSQSHDVPVPDAAYSTAREHSKAFLNNIITWVESLNSDLNAEAWYPSGDGSAYPYYTGLHTDNLPYFYLDNEVFKWRVAADNNAADSVVADLYYPFHRGLTIIGGDSISELSITFKMGTTTYNTSSLDSNNNNEHITSNDAGVPQTGDFYNVYDHTGYLEINASEMELFNDKGKHNVAFYSKTETDTEVPGDDQNTYRMKVLKDIEGQKELYAGYVDENGENIYYDIPSQPDKVSLSKKNADIYIGTGNLESTKTKWFGKIKHKQFDTDLDDYRLLDSELMPIDDGQAVFNLDVLTYGMHNAADTVIQHDKAYGLSYGSQYIYGIDLSSSTSSNSDKGVQVKSDVLPFTPTVLSYSKIIHDKLKGLSSQAWTEDSVTIAASVTHTDGQTAHWVTPSKTRREISIITTDFNTSANTVGATETARFNLSFASGESPPVAGVMTDILETSSSDSTEYTYCLFTNPDNTAFTFDQEWLFGFDWDTDVNWATKTITMHAHTPSALKMSKAKGGTMPGETLSGQDNHIYFNPACVDADLNRFEDGWASDWNYDAYSNRIRLRLIDDMGDHGSNEWMDRRAEKWRDSSDGTMYLGNGGGWYEEYEVTPHVRGLFKAENNEVGLIAHFKGDYVTNNGSLSVGRKSDWPDRRYYIYPSECGTTQSIDQAMAVFPHKSHKGVKHIRVSNGSSGNGWKNTATLFTEDSDAIRLAGYRRTSTRSECLVAREFANNTVSSGHEKCNDITQTQPINNIICITKSPYTTGTIIKSVVGEQTNATTLMKWVYSFPTNGGNTTFGEALSVVSPGSNDHEPSFLEYLGSSTFASHENSAVTTQFFFSPTMGQYINAMGKYTSNNNSWDTSFTNFETVAGYPATYVSFLNHSKLDYGITITDGDVVSGDAFNFDASKVYYYKMSLLYDGYQESPLTTFHFKYDPVQNCDTANVKIILNKPSPRATDVVIYRKNNIEDYYRLVEQVSLEKSWADTSLGGGKFKIIVDNGSLSATYEAITGMPETLRNTSINYKLSTSAGGYLLAGNCFHKEITNGQNYIFRSQPNAFSVFDWSSNYLVLPNEPTALAYWSGRLYAFDNTNMYRIDINNMFIEDDHKGVGCFGEESYVVTDYGMYFADANNIYFHDGNKVSPIATDILDIADSSTAANLRKAWHNINHAKNPIVAYNAYDMNVMVLFEDVDGTTGCWNYNLPRKRWDYMDTPKPLSYVQGPNGQRYLSDGKHLFELNNSKKRKNYTFHSPKIDMQLATQDKKFKAAKLVFNSMDEKDNASYSCKINLDHLFLSYSHPGTTFVFEDDQNVREYKLEEIPVNKFKKFQITVTDCDTEIDAIGLIYDHKTVK